MAAGFKYNIEPEKSVEERYDVSTGIRRRGPYKLDTTNLPVGEYIPSFTPIYADLVNKTATVAVRAKVVEAYTNGTDNVTIRVAKGSYLMASMFVGNGSNGASISSIGKTNVDYDEITISAAFGANLAVGDVLFESTDGGGTTPKVIANSALYERKKVEEGIVLVALLSRAFEIEPTKLVTPFADIDKANMPHFQFNEQDVVNQEKETVPVTNASSSQDGLMSKEDKAKLDGIALQANKYTLTAATTSALGGVKQAEKVNDATDTVSAENFNGLLTALKNAGLMAK